MERFQARLLLAVGVASLALYGCGGDDGGDSTEADGSVTECDAGDGTQGISDDTIKLGAFTPLSGPIGTVGQDAVDGQQVVFDAVNAEGGIDGREIELVAVDDEYSPAISQQAVRRLEERDQVFAISGGAGTPNMVAALPYIKQREIPVIGPYAPSNQIGTMDNPTVYMIWPDYKDEYQAITEYMVADGNVENVAILTRPDDVGQDGLAGAEAALEAHGMELVATVTADALATDFSPQAVELRDSEADAVLIVSQPTGTGQAIKAMKGLGYQPQFGSSSDQADQTWADAWGADAEGMITAAKIAPFDGGDPMVEEFLQAFEDSTGKEAGLWNAVGYAQGLVTVEALRNAPALSRDCLEYSLQQMQNFETGLIPPVTFGPEERQGTKAVGLMQLEDGAFKKLTGFEPLPD